MERENICGRIVKGVGGLYTVRSDDLRIYECRAKGLFRKNGEKPLVGDFVDISVISDEEGEGLIEHIRERKNSLIRPEVANVDRIYLLTASREPAPNMDMLNRYLCMMRDAGIPVTIVVTKTDQADEERLEKFREAFVNTDFPIFMISVREHLGIDELREDMKGCVCALAGPSGAGKSTLLNCLLESEIMETGTLSRKIARGKNTTRHSELFSLPGDTYVFDTPGFTSVDISYIEPDRLADYFDEFTPFLGHCRYLDCRHIKEPDCRIKEAVREGQISRSRYRSYRIFYEELKNIRRY